MPPVVSHPPLAAAARAGLAEWLTGWSPVGLLRARHPALCRACRRLGLADGDVRSAALFGVVRAAQDFDPARGCEFQTYALPWVRSFVGRELERHLRRGFSSTGDDEPDAPESGDWRIQGRSASVGLWDTLTAEGGADPTERAGDRLDARAATAEALRWLSPRQRAVVRLRFGLAGDPPMRLAEIAALMGCSRERVRQIVDDGLTRMYRGLRQRQTA